ncbi:MAG: hypothetical protein K9I68_05840 [Bacteroidales bacterium]|nr:hypothetical protein [Bacteroidales bacterium]MCF8338784.1 hypothetical protein [Bacteroidales bacterium]
MKENEKDIERFLESLGDKYDMLEEGIDMETQKVYIEHSHSFGEGELNDEELDNIKKVLFHPETDIEGKKRALSLLAHLKSIRAFRVIEEYYNNPDHKIKQWTALALQESKMMLESMVFGLDKVYLSSGLGGIRNKMRFYFMVLPLTGQLFTKTHHDIIRKELSLVYHNKNAEVENIDSQASYVGITSLVPLNVAVGPLIEEVIEKCNELGDFVFEHYYITNGNIPDKTEIQEIIEIVRGEKPAPEK